MQFKTHEAVPIISFPTEVVPVNVHVCLKRGVIFISNIWRVTQKKFLLVQQHGSVTYDVILNLVFDLSKQTYARPV